MMKKTMTNRITKPTAKPILGPTPWVSKIRKQKRKNPVDYKLETYTLQVPKRTVLLTDPPQLADGVTILVESLTKMCGDWEGTKQFDGTPARLARMYSELCWSPEKIKHELDSQFRVFSSSYDEMVVEGPIVVWTLCPHHLLPCLFEVTIGYVPTIAGEDGHRNVLGLSKLARVADILGRRPVMQEEYTTELAGEFESRLAPKGVAVHVKGHHGCMQARGVKQNAPVVTAVIRGDFKNATTRAEFYSIVKDLEGK